MPLLNGIEAAGQIKKTDPHIKVVFLTMHPDVTYETRAFEAGASSYVLKYSAPSEAYHGNSGNYEGRDLNDEKDYVHFLNSMYRYHVFPACSS
jgi:DNA-binding NarL/FixJ family response regulator